MKKPLVYISQANVQSIFDHVSQNNLDCFGAIAVGKDEDDLFHIYLTDSSNPHAESIGSLCRAAIRFSDVALENTEQALRLAKETVQHCQDATSTQGKRLVLLLLSLSTTGAINGFGFIRNTDDTWIEGTLKFIPGRSELYSRSSGLLETSLLEQKRVAVVGLGSGGGTIALELAKAGVGHFTLIDFDRLELSNISRHICGIHDLGRYKTYAVRDRLLEKNPHIGVQTHNTE